MKTLKYFSLFIAAGLFAACSDNLTEGNGVDNDTSITGKGYVNIGINLPTTNGSSRAYSDNFQNGEKEEYAVNDVIIALFYGIDESSATCKFAFSIKKDQFFVDGTNNNGDNITTSFASGAVMIPQPAEKEQVFALALVNAPNGFSVSKDVSTDQAGESDANDVLFLDGAKINSLNDLSAIQASNIKKVENDQNYYFMSNAPLAVYRSSIPDYTTQTLAPITVYKDKSSAEAGAASNPIYVERAAAKVVVNIKDGGNDNTLTIDGTKYPYYAGSTVKFEGWTLQNTNKTFYPVRSVSDFATWYEINQTRFISNTSFGTTNQYRRIYWGIDTNYDVVTEDNNNIFENITPTNFSAIGSYEYCPENTTTANNMTSDKLTSVLLKATFTPGEFITGEDFFMKSNTSAIYTGDQLVNWAIDVLNRNDDTKLSNGENVTIVGSLPNTGFIAQSQEDISKLLSIPGTGDELSKRLAALWNDANGDIKYYHQGITYYYATAIKHFGDDIEAPEDGAYEDKHLGRYGVVRNTWYEINIILGIIS